MIEQANTAVGFTFAVTDADGVGVTGLEETCTINVYDETGTQVETDLDHTDGFFEIGDGAYRLPYTPDAEGEWLAVCKTPEDGWVYAQWTIGRAGVENLDHSIQTVDGIVDAIKAVTDLLPDGGALTDISTDTARLTAARAQVLTDLIDGGRLDLLVDAIRVVTDALPDSGALTSIAKETTVEGLNDLDAAGVRGAVGLAAANLDTQLGDLPTNAELATALAAADDAVLAAIDALNDLSAAQVNAEVDTAIADAALATAAALQTAQTAITAVKGKTDQLTFSNSAVDANMERINDVEIAGAGVAGNKFEPV